MGTKIKESEKKKEKGQKEKAAKTVKKQKENVHKVVSTAKENKGKAEKATTLEDKLAKLAKRTVMKAKKIQSKIFKQQDANAGNGFSPPPKGFSEVKAKKALA